MRGGHGLSHPTKPPVPSTRGPQPTKSHPVQPRAPPHLRVIAWGGHNSLWRRWGAGQKAGSPSKPRQPREEARWQGRDRAWRKALLFTALPQKAWVGSQEV